VFNEWLGHLLINLFNLVEVGVLLFTENVLFIYTLSSSNCETEFIIHTVGASVILVVDEIISPSAFMISNSAATFTEA